MFFFFEYLVVLIWREICSGFDGERDYGHHERDMVVFKSSGFERG